jgi:hypothetical protein
LYLSKQQIAEQSLKQQIDLPIDVFSSSRCSQPEDSVRTEYQVTELISISSLIAVCVYASKENVAMNFWVIAKILDEFVAINIFLPSNVKMSAVLNMYVLPTRELCRILASSCQHELSK